ncbi:hypothetical protein C8J57DRAFT_1277429 [Mycena rebaudengoi]|nr:hypothetical protein C8J57DRAFT_1277429 [Mycena rebaudengoi]
MSRTEIQIPLDIVLEISASMDLQHSLRLLATCKDYQSLSSSKAFWVRALKRVTDVHRRPLPCPSATEPSTMALEKLREMAIRAYTLMQNWSAENPTPVNTHTVKTSPLISGLHFIPGTHLIIVVSKNSDIVCWDTIAGTCLGSITSPSSRYITIGSNPLELPGQCFFGVGYHCDFHIELAVICIDYSDSANVTIDKSYSYEWVIPDSSHHFFDVALDGNQIGMIVGSGYTSDIPLALVFCNHREKLIHCINTQLLTTRGRLRKNPPRCLIHAGQFYIATQNKLAMDIYHVRTDSSSLQATPALPSSLRRVGQASHSHDTHLSYKLRSPTHGVFGVTQGSLLPDIGTDSGDLDCPIDHVYFWPAIDTGTELNLEPTCSYEHNHPIYEMCVSSSGRSAVISCKSYDLQSSFGLIQYVAHPTPHTTFRPLDIPCDVYDSLKDFALDDSLGVLYLQISDRVIAVLSFA